MIAGVAALSTVLRSAVGWAARDRRRGLRTGGCRSASAPRPWCSPSAAAPPGVTPDERAGLEVMATVARTVPCDARVLVNVRTAGSFEVLAGRTSIDEGMAPYLRPPVLRRVLPIVLGAHRFFRDPAANRAFIENQHVDVVVAVAGARVGRPADAEARPARRPGRRPLAAPARARPARVTIYATPSLARGLEKLL